MKYLLGFLLFSSMAFGQSFDNLVVKNNGVLKLKELRSNGSSEVNIIGPASLAADRTLTLPDATDTLT